MPASLHVNIPEPCHENWQNMTPNQQGRHCMSCQKTVVDFTLMSDQEILNHISRASSNICGRFDEEQLDKVYEEKKIRRSFSFRYAWNVVVATFLLTGNAAMAQSKNPVKKKEMVNSKDKTDNREQQIILGGIASIIPDRKITGEIIDDSTGKPVSFASIRIKGVKTGLSANEAGRFDLVAPGRKNKITLIASAIGYADNEFEVPVDNGKLYKIMLAPEADELKPVVVVGFPATIGKIVGGPVVQKVAPSAQKDTSCLSGIAGGLSVTRKITTVEKIKRTVNEWVPKKDVRIYPNPVEPGSSININMDLNETGEYKLELMDASGKLVLIQPLQVAQKTQTVSVPTQSFWSRGIYWLRLSNGTTKKIYQAKVLLQ
jgi:CarboxypepD_reg-like domain/Secretion system C-terminal sorting domain